MNVRVGFDLPRHCYSEYHGFMLCLNDPAMHARLAINLLHSEQVKTTLCVFPSGTGNHNVRNGLIAGGACLALLLSLVVAGGSLLLYRVKRQNTQTVHNASKPLLTRETSEGAYMVYTVFIYVLYTHTHTHTQDVISCVFIKQCCFYPYLAADDVTERDHTHIAADRVGKCI